MKLNKENEKGKCKKRWYYILPSCVFVYCDARCLKYPAKIKHSMLRLWN
jgi:hypothetical protein